MEVLKWVGVDKIIKLYVRGAKAWIRSSSSPHALFVVSNETNQVPDIHQASPQSILKETFQKIGECLLGLFLV